MKPALAYITTANRDEAIKIGSSLVETRLAACINILDGMQSIYWWQGKIEEAQECVLIVKTRQGLKDQVVAKVKELHSYACPCVVFSAIEGGNPDYIKWIIQETDSV